MLQDALAQLRQAPAESPQTTSGIAYLFAVTDKRDEAQKMLDQMKESAKRRYVSPYAIATVYSGPDDNDQTFEWLEEGCKDHDLRMLQLGSDPRFDRISTDSRLRGLLRRMGLLH